jgi:hypothetical protein
LKNLDRIMDKAVYQKKRLSNDKKRVIMKQMREQENSPSLIEKYLWIMKPVLSITVCLFLLIFSVTYILEPPNQPQERLDGLILDGESAVTSLPLLNRISNLAMQENKYIDYVNISKSDRYVSLSIEIVENSSKADVRSTIEKMFLKGTELYTGNSEMNEIGEPWTNYTVDITVVKQYDRNRMWEEERDPAFIRGVKQKDQKQITWLDKEKNSH